MNDTVIRVMDFRKVYGDFVAVDGISFEVHRGEIFGLLGPNGAGKRVRWRAWKGYVFLMAVHCELWMLTQLTSRENCIT